MTGTIIILLLTGGAGLLILSNGRGKAPDLEKLVELIDTHLPQTQCGKCGYPGCRPYAEAIARNEADINQCPPGGVATIKILAKLLNRPFRPLNPQYGVERPPTVAFIDEQECIGCAKCLKACPVDAIIGAPKQMHTVIAEICTGCELCIEPCPVDCIHMLGGMELRRLQLAERDLAGIPAGRPGRSAAAINGLQAQA